MKIITNIRIAILYSKKLKELSNCINKIKEDSEVLSNWENLKIQILNIQKKDIEILPVYLSPYVVNANKFFSIIHNAELYGKLTKIREMKVNAVQNQNFEWSANLRDAEKKVYSELFEEYIKFKENKVIHFRMHHVKQIEYLRTDNNEIEYKMDNLIKRAML